MKVKKLPFNIDFLKDVPLTYTGMIPITSMQIFEGRHGDFNPEGLYSNIIFGKSGDESRDQLFSYINLKVPVFHPFYYQELVRLKKLYGEILNGKGYAIWDEKLKDFVRSDIMSGETGYSFFMSHFAEVVFLRNESKERDLRIDLLEKFRSKCVIHRLIVIPAGLRDIEIRDDGQPKEDDINPLYRKIISITNTINVSFEDRYSEILDGSKANLTNAVVDVYKYLFDILEGKKGFLQGKLASRRIVGSTRNILSSMEASSDHLGSDRQLGLNSTVVGMFQFIKGCEPWVKEYALKNKFAAEFFEHLKDEVTLINKRTLLRETVRLKEKTKDKWGTDEGLSGIINTFEDARLRHRPVSIEGRYLKLIYQDEKSFRILDSIDDVPEGFNRELVRPMTWAEFFYLHVHEFVKKCRGFVTRYPVMTVDSIYPSEIYLKSTTTGYNLDELGPDWKPTGVKALEFPATSEQLVFFETMSVSPFKLPGLGADFDGDVLSLVLVYGDESVKEIIAMLKNKYTYLSPTGGLTNPITTDVTDWVLSFMTGE